MYAYFLQTKLAHPTKVILCRVGEFYETLGIDAILLVQHAGLNPMGREGNPPKAGCPRVNLRRTVADLVQEAGLSVVVCEEVPEGYQYGAKKPPKQRYVAAVVTPAAPHFVHGLIDEDADLILDSAPPLLGIAPRVGGYAVIEIDAELQTVRVTEGLTEDAVYARLHEGGLAPPLFLHIPPAGAGTDKRLSESISEGEWEQRVGAVFRSQVGAVQRYDDVDPVQGMVERVKRQLNLPADIVFRELPAASPKTRPRPLYYASASNLGLHKTRGVPSLIDYALPAGAPLTSRRWLRRLLLLPPPPAVGLAIHAACAALQSATGPVPAFSVMTPANIVLKLRTKEANDTFFRELGELCRAVAGACSDPQLAEFSSAVLVAAAAETGVKLSREILAEACFEALRAIHDVVDHDTELRTGRNEENDNSSGASLDGSSEGEDDLESGEGSISDSIAANDGFYSGESTISDKDASLRHVDSQLDGELGALERLFGVCEDFRGKVRIEKLQKAAQKVDSAREIVIKEGSEALKLAIHYWDSASRTKVGKPALVYDVSNNAAWLRIPRGLPLTKDQNVLIHPKDRNGKPDTAFFSTPTLEEAQDNYRRACSEARDAVRAELRKLAERLEPIMTQLVAAATVAIVASALDAHVREAARRGWSLPHLDYGPDGKPTGIDTTLTSSFEAQAPSELDRNKNAVNDSSNNNYVESAMSSSSSSGGVSAPSSRLDSFRVEGMWPYWLGGPGGIDPGTVKNSFHMDGMFLLTGPNMAGKSTILRSTCAVALLGACGLAVPAAPNTVIPYFDAFMLRNFSADSPLEGRSSFAVEMTEMRYVLADATARSLVLVDELGKGTEARAGAALAGAMLEALASEGCRGVFATHLHSLLDMGLDLPGTKRMMMDIEKVESEEGGQRAQRRPTWRMVEGQSVESLALEVAADCRLPEKVVERAAGLYEEEMMKERENGSEGGDSISSRKENLEAVNRSAAGAASTAAAVDQPQASEGDLRASAASLGLGLPEPSQALKNASAVLEATTRNVLAALSRGSSPDTIQNITAQFVPEGQVPPARTVGASCVYIARHPNGWFYVGSTDSLQDRIKAHRQRGGNSRVADPGAEFAYVAVFEAGAGGAGASAAKSVEAEVIKAMQAAQFPLLSDTDARKRYAPMPQYMRDRAARFR